MMDHSKNSPPTDGSSAAAASLAEAEAAQFRQDEAAMHAMPGLRISPFRPFAAGLFTGVVAAALATFGLLRADILSQYDFLYDKTEQAISIPAADVAAAKAVIPEITDAVNRLRSLLENDPDSLAIPSGDRFYPAASVWPEEYKNLSRAARTRLGFVIRQDGSAYKILLSSEFCPVFDATGAINKDPVRTRSRVLCEYFSVWNAGGRDF